MSWPTPVYRRVQGVPDHLHRFGDQLRELAVEVRHSVAGLAGEAVGRAVRDTLTRFWQQNSRSPIASSRDPMQRESHGWGDDPSDDSRESEEPRWEEPQRTSTPPARSATSFTNRASQVLQATGLLLQQNGSWITAISAGLGLGGLTLLSGRLAVRGFDLVEAVVDLSALYWLLSSGSKLFRGN